MTPEDIRAHVERRLPGFEADMPVRLLGGLLNWVWRVPGRPDPVVVKIAPPFVAAAPEIPLDSARLLIEARCLALLGPGGALADVSTDTVRPPRLLDVDADHHVLVMEDLGVHPDLGSWLRDGGPCDAAGRRLGRFIGQLHAATLDQAQLAAQLDNASVQQTRLRVQYRAVGDFFARAGHPEAEALGAQAAALGERFLQPGRCLVMGDLWPASVLVSEHNALRVIDWELAHFGSPAQDVAHLAAHLWMHRHRAPSPRVAEEAQEALDAFLASYRETLGDAAAVLLTPAVLRDSAVHFGAEVLMRAAGTFQPGALYDGLPPGDPAVQEAVAVAAAHIGAPDAVDTFALLRAPGA